MPKLTILELNGNEITRVDDFRSFYAMQINLNGNPLHCGAALSWMGEEEMEFEKDLVCATPTCLRDMAIADMSKSSNPCNLNILRMRQNGWHFANEIYKIICLCGSCYICGTWHQWVINGLTLHLYASCGLQVPWNSMDIHGTARVIEIKGGFKGDAPWNFVQIQSSMEFHGTFSILPGSMEFHGTSNYPEKSSMEIP